MTLSLQPQPGAAIVGKSRYDFVDQPDCIYALRIAQVSEEQIVLIENQIRGSCTGEDKLQVRLLDKDELFVAYEIPEKRRRGEGTLKKVEG